MKLLPNSIAELDPNLQWSVEIHLRILEEVVLSTEPSEPRGLSKAEAERRMARAVVRGDWRAEEAAIADYLRIELGEWWQDFAEQQLLKLHYERTNRRRQNSGTRYSMRPPEHAEGVRVARALLADLPYPGSLDTEEEAATVAKVLAGHGLVTYGFPSRARMREYIRESRKSRVHFDALCEIIAEWERRGEAIPRRLAKWRLDVTDGRLQRPDAQPIPRHRPTNPAQLPYQMQIQFTIEILQWLGVPPQGSPTSGCRIVAEAKDIPEDTVVRIWKKRTWKTSFLPTMRKQSMDMAIRHGTFHPN